MRINLKKIASVLASAVMIGSTAGVGMAAAYPEPFVSGGSADSAVVITSGDHAGAISDWDSAVSVQGALQGLVTTTSGTTAGTVTGEAYALFTGSTKLYLNDTLDKVRNTVTETEMPTVLADGAFSGDVEADFTQTIILNNHPQILFGKQPTSDDDPTLYVRLGTTTANHIYNVSFSFDKTVNFTHTDSEGETMTLMGQKFTVGTDTDDDELVLFKSSETFSLSVGGSAPASTAVTVEGSEYTIELTAATDSSATVKVTDSDGNSDSKEINEADSKKIQGLEVAVNLADESTATSIISAEVTVGAQKVVLKDGDEVKIGSDEDIVDGTNVDFVNTAYPGNMTKFVIQMSADDSDEDAIIEGGVFTDPVFGTFKIDFSGLNIPEISTVREDITLKASGNDKFSVEFTNHNGDTKTVDWFYNDSVTCRLADSSGNKIKVVENAMINKSQYVVAGNEDDGYLLELTKVSNATSGYANDEVTFKDVFSDNTYSASISAEGTGTIIIGGKSYSIVYSHDRALDSPTRWARLNYPDSTGNNLVIYPTIETSKGAKLAFYEPVNISLSNLDGKTTGANTVAGLLFPDGDGYETISLGINVSDEGDIWNVTDGSTETQMNTSGLVATGPQTAVVVTINAGSSNALQYNLSAGGLNRTWIYLIDPDAGVGNIDKPALIIWEEEDDNNNYEAIVVKMSGSATSTSPVSVSDVQATWCDDDCWDNEQLESDDDMYKDVDLWGTIVSTDKSDSDQYTAVISYPDEQVYAQVYVAEEGASITAATTSGGAGGGTVLVVKDSEVSSVKSNNLIVVGGSCVNTVAAKILGVDYPTCGEDFTTASGAGAGQYLIKSVKASEAVDGGSEDKVAVLVAGYDAADTVSAVNKLKEGETTDVDTSNVYPLSATE